MTFKEFVEYSLEIILIVVIGLLVVLLLSLVFWTKSRKGKSKGAKVDKDNISVLVNYVKAQQQEDEENRRIKELKKIDNREKLESFRRDKEQLRH